MTRVDIVKRGITNCCPNCGGHTLFTRGKFFAINRTCEACGLKFERDEGAFLGAVALNYGITCTLYLVPVLLCYLGELISGLTAIILAGVGAIAVPMIIYRPSRSWWLMNYYFFLPQHLPANQESHLDREPGK